MTIVWFNHNSFNQMDAKKLVTVAVLVFTALRFGYTKKGPEFHLANITTCDKPDSYIFQVEFEHINVTHNVLQAKGVVRITESLSNKVGILLQYRKSPFGREEYSSSIDFLVPEPCQMVVKKTIFGDPIGHSFRPPLRCPPKKGTYEFNFNTSLKQVANIPEPKTKYLMNLFFLDSTKQKKVMCLKFVVWMQ